MISPHLIDRALALIVTHCDPELVYVFGSHATGTAKPSSDLDLLIVQRSNDAKARREREVEQLLARLLIPVDVNVYTPEELAEELVDPYGFVRCATTLQGKLVHSRALGDFDALTRRWNTEPSRERHARLSATADEWWLYQHQYAAEVRGFREPPWAFAAAVLRRHPGWRVADFGCGEALLARSVENVVSSFDHIAAGPGVIGCDIASPPLADESVDAVVLSMALVCSNWDDVVSAAWRALRPGGRILLTERSSGARSPEAIAMAMQDLGLSVQAAPCRDGFVDLEAHKLR
jgi:predicted nucleotidyltransferase